LVISHDRYFLDRVVQRILELDEGTLAEYLGGYSDYQAARAVS
jgi:ATPase subunit of ABC transporter with duplicated ATPase domains